MAERSSKGKRDIIELRPASNHGEEKGTSEGNVVVLACSRNGSVASRPVLQRQPGHLRPPDSAAPRRSGRGAGRPSRGPAPLEDGPRRVSRRTRGHVARESIALNRGASREAAPTRRAPPQSEASRRTPQFPLRTGNGPASPAALP